MTNLTRTAMVFGVLLGVVPATTHAHFKLLEPASWLMENDRGDPQKAGPCGGSNTDWGKPSYIVTKVMGGSRLRVRVQETIFHPGHYRVALAVNSPTELPPDPETQTRASEKGPWSVTATIQNPPRVPVLADGLFPHTARVETPFETEVQLPNINCRKCTLQVVQWMAEHAFNNPGGYSYHHCADLQITADPSKPTDKEWPADR
jgi:hypothetical protein